MKIKHYGLQFKIITISLCVSNIRYNIKLPCKNYYSLGICFNQVQNVLGIIFFYSSHKAQANIELKCLIIKKQTNNNNV